MEQDIQAYLSGKLEGKNLTAFEQQLKNDPSFAEEVAFQKSLHTVFLNEDLMATHALLKNLGQTNPVQPDFNDLPIPALRTTSTRWIGGVGIVLVIVGIFAFFRWQSVEQNKEKEKNQAIAVQFLAKATPFSNHVGFSEQNNNPFAVAMRQYDSATKYADAAANLKKYLKDNTDNTAQLYLGVCYLYTMQPDSAILQLQPLTSVTEDFVAQSARWHLGLAYLQNGNAKAARPLLQSGLTNEEFKEQAELLLNTLDK